MNDRVILIDKPPGMTSFGVVARVRRVLSHRVGKKVKVGHCGTLDPFATGLLILVTGKECRNAMRYTKLDKVYEATFRLGQTSTTGDPEGEIMPYIASSKPQNDAQASPISKQPDIAVVKSVLVQFVGDIKQRPPAFSAIKINGQRAYKLARSGKKVDIPERAVTIYALELLDYSYPLLKVRAHVSSGTYIRSLAADIGEALNTGAYCQELRRTQIADWQVSQAQKLADFGIES
jgi:tRNA pseudouridine synthase B